MADKHTNYRYNTGAKRVPWVSVGENYNAEDLVEVVKFLMQGEGKEYDEIIKNISKDVEKLDKISTPPGRLSLAGEVSAVEEESNKFLGVDNSTLVTNCTAGFEIAYKYANLKPGDEVIVPAITFVSTMSYALSVGAKIVFADIDPITLNMDPKDVAKKITPKTKMIVPVHIGGYPVDIDPIMELAKKHNIVVLEDAAHAFGAKYKGRMVGTTGHFASFSFHEVKNITAFGEGGIVTTSVPEFKEYMKLSRFVGADFSKVIDKWCYDVVSIPGKTEPFVAVNYAPTEIQALGLRMQMKRIKDIIAARKAAVTYLNSRFAECDALIPQSIGNEDYEPTFHLYQLQIVPEKAGGDVQTFKKKLEEKSVTTIPHYAPLYHFSLMKDMGYDKDEIAKTCPVAEDLFANKFTHLPLYGLSPEQLEYMADMVLEVIDEMKQGK